MSAAAAVFAEAASRLPGSEEANISGIKETLLLMYSQKAALPLLPVSEKIPLSSYGALELYTLGTLQKPVCVC